MSYTSPFSSNEHSNTSPLTSTEHSKKYVDVSKQRESESSSKPMSWIYDRLPVYEISVNRAAQALIAGGCLLGAAYTISNPHPQNPQSPDFEGGMGIALGSSMLISGVTAAIQYMRGKKEDSYKWLAGMVCVGAIGVGVLKSTTPQKQEMPSEEMNVAVSKRSLVPERYAYLEDCNPVHGDDLSSKVYRVSCPKFQAGKEYVDQENLLTNEEKAATGHTKTFILRKVGIVLKKDSWSRVLKMEETSQLCEKNGYQHFKIAEATVYKDFVIENLLPIDKQGLFLEKQQMGIYLDNLDAFTPAVKEFTGFLCQADHDDLNSRQSGNILGKFANDYTPRFDNAVLYMEGEVGKIAIPDLDSVELKAPSEAKIDDAIRFFPFHYDQIIEEAKKYYPNLDKQDPQLLKVRDNALKYYDNLYTKHLNHIESHSVNSLQPDYMPEIDQETLNKIQEAALEKVYHTVENEEWFSDCLKNVPKEEFFNLGKIALNEVNMVSELRKLIQSTLTEKNNPTSELDSKGKLLKFRSLMLDQAYKKEIEKIIDSLATKLEELNPGFGSGLDSPAQLFIETIFEQFEKHEIIASYRSTSYGHVIFA